MNLLEQFALISFMVQLIHSSEELLMGFHKKWYLFKMPFRVFIIFEICFSLFWGMVVFNKSFPSRSGLLAFFLALMFANGVQHVVWFGWAKKYVPGLITAPVHILVFLIFYYQVLF
jgi:hypothetical protein